MKNNVEKKIVPKNNFYSFFKLCIGDVCIYMMHLGMKADGPCSHVVYGKVEKENIKSLHC